MFVNVRNTARQWCNYSLTLSGKLIYIGACKFSDLMQFPDANKNSEFIKLVKHSDFLELELLGMHSNPDAATANQFTLIDDHKPYCNLNGKQFSKSSKVHCITTGEIFPDAATACEACGITREYLRNSPAGKIRTDHARASC